MWHGLRPDPLAVEPGQERPDEDHQQENPQNQAKEHTRHHETHASVHHRVHHHYSTPFVCLSCLWTRSAPFRVSSRTPSRLKEREGRGEETPEPPASHRQLWLIGHVQGGEAMHHSNKEVPRLLWGET